jgi:hypothetical protein
VLIIGGTVAVSDFGLGRHMRSTTTDLTVVGGQAGTFGYVAPEQWRDLHEVDARADIFALGSVLFHLATGENPATHNPRIRVPRFGFVINRCREPDPDRRYSSVEELRADFERLWELDPDATPLTERAMALMPEAPIDRTQRKGLIELYLRNTADIELYTATIPRWPVELLTLLVQENRDDLAAIISVFEGHIDGHLAFDAVDGLVDCLLRIFYASDDEQLRRIVLTRILLMGERHKRFYAGRKFTSLANSARTASEIIAIRDVLYANPRAAKWVSEWVNSKRASSLIVSAIGQETVTLPRPALSFTPRLALPGTDAVRADTTVESLGAIQSRLRYEAGQHVWHPKFGHGEVTEVFVRGRDQEVAVRFENYGQKRLLGSLAAMEIVTPAHIRGWNTDTDSKSVQRYLPGQSVRHPKFGNGRVTEVYARGNDQRVVVEFQRHGNKHLLGSLSRMDILNSPG